MRRNRFILISLIIDAIAINASIIAAFLIRFGGVIPRYNFEAYLKIFPIVTLAYLFSGWIYGLYEPENINSPWSVTRPVLLAVSLGTVLTAAIAFLGGQQTIALARWTIFISWAIIIVVYVGWRIALLRMFPLSYPEKRVLILGVNQTAADLASSFEKRKKWGWNFIGFVAVDDEDQQSYRSNRELTHVSRSTEITKILGSISHLDQLLTEHNINRLVVAKPVNIRSLIEKIVLDDDYRITIDVVPDLYEVFIGSINSIVGDIPLVRVATAQASAYQSSAKRAGDLIGFFLVMLITLPVWLFAILGIVLTDGFPIFYRQERVGLNQKTFEVIKFRTMRKNAEETSGPVLATEEDPRITAFGKFLRLSRIDELPQLINVLRGEMSFIGPRPERPVFVEEYIKEIPGYRERFRALPGLTGLAQVNGGYATTPERKLKYDLMYIYNQTLSMDAQIVAETFKVILTGKGAR